MQAQIPPEVQKRYMTLKNDYNTIFKTVVNMEDEKREHMYNPNLLIKGWFSKQ